MRNWLPLFALGLLLSILALRPVSSASDFTYFPTASTTDGRFMAIGGGSLQTLPNQAVELEIGVLSTEQRFEIGIFDGDTSGTWDVGAIPVRYRLFTDGKADG